MQFCATPQDVTPTASCSPDWRHRRPSKTQWPKPPIVSKMKIPTRLKIRQARSASQETMQTSWEDRTRVSMSDSPSETELDEKWNIGGVSELEITLLLEQDQERPWRSIGRSLRKRSMKVRQKVRQLFRLQSIPTTPGNEASRTPSYYASKTSTDKEKAAETAGGGDSLNDRKCYREATRLYGALAAPFAIMGVGYPMVIF
ncbi:uncharacterized protein LY79DRAFT_188299 [Colletotrichum navitas]|uniref:Uncharacterized protein n=1 Tax=Colletotrichum navitas TaxID=681940 RepID=A0AAD8Q0K6_9PEZI|nr:uncharacterized protein LY79DRAFT_188299 [Colletotrichum navitas]KAK1593127.1 hypothetical protein LY79DRAFT_188299 [Colletotrichum navitas]